MTIKRPWGGWDSAGVCPVGPSLPGAGSRYRLAHPDRPAGHQDGAHRGPPGLVSRKLATRLPETPPTTMVRAIRPATILGIKRREYICPPRSGIFPLLLGLRLLEMPFRKGIWRNYTGAKAIWAISPGIVMQWVAMHFSESTPMEHGRGALQKASVPPHSCLDLKSTLSERTRF